MITVVYGTRPEAIKLASVVTALRAGGAQVHVICTGQHRELLDGVDLKPDVSLDLMRPDQEPSDFVVRAMQALDVQLRGARQLVVQGDTATAFAAALAAFHRRIPIAHIEAGLRTYRLDSPWPEEGYRQMIDRLASRLYAPTETAMDNILYERAGMDRPILTGNPGIDAALSVPCGLPASTERPFALVTVHRREAFGEPLAAIVRAVERISRRIWVIWPVHPNPRVRDVVVRELGKFTDRVHLPLPLPYPAMIATLRAARFVITDSGGIQEEAPTFGIPALVVREVTERPEALVAGSSLLVGFDEDRIYSYAKQLCEDSDLYRNMAVPRQLYGDGHAGERIAQDLLEGT